MGFDDNLLEIKTRLTRGSSDLQTVALVGMGGIGLLDCTKKLSNEMHKESIEKFVELLYMRKSQSFLKNVTFPELLKKLTLVGGYIPWEDMTIVGSLPVREGEVMDQNALIPR
ncbi:Uncharacterized protein Adt_47836 [Abeliophyllum distichum]|uniref:Uncharacterized protein n=1 Tax=Abeliophyllum distichum TaxID=126358 RepID=A0ABD1NSS8_9LAMI